jgi:hypothetical protein
MTEIETASSFIRAHGSKRDREMRAYYHAYGRFADLLTLAAKIAADQTTSPARHLTVAA